MAGNFLRRTFSGYLQEFIHDSRSIGIFLFAGTVISLVLANLPFGAAYVQAIGHEWHFFEALHLPHSPLHWINDGLMAVFFWLVGMEIKREVTSGELASLKRAILPVGGAVGGMLVPAAIYVLITRGSAYQHGWGVPMATDIAFTLAVAAMLGKRFPAGLKIFITALAIIDDLGAILVIALFYGGAVQGWFLLAAAVIISMLWLLNFLKVRFGMLHYVLGAALWYCIFNSGIHATIAGVLFAFMVPDNMLEKLEHAIHNWVNFLILPLFAVANTAIIINGGMLPQLGGGLSLGIMAGLFIGKPLGIVFASWLLVRKKVAVLPRGIGWKHMWGAGLLAGIGFTMSIFIASLAFTSPQQQDVAKLAILCSALLSIVAGCLWMRKI